MSEDLQQQFDAVEKEIEALEDKRQTQTKEFIDLLHRKLALSQELKKFQEVNNCEMRIRFIEARMRGEEMPHTEMVNFERKERRKRRDKVNTMFLLVVAVVVMMIGSVPVLKMIVERNRTLDDVMGATEAPAPQVVTPTPAPTPPPVQQVLPSQELPSAVEEANKKTGGKELDLKQLLKPGRMTVLEFSSIHCSTCRRMHPQYENLARQYPDWKFYTVDVDRPFSEGIDWESPVAKQFKVGHLPYFIIYNGTKKEAEDRKAAAKLQELSLAATSQP